MQQAQKCSWIIAQSCPFLRFRKRMTGQQRPLPWPRATNLYPLTSSTDLLIPVSSCLSISPEGVCRDLVAVSQPGFWSRSRLTSVKVTSRLPC